MHRPILDCPTKLGIPPDNRAAHRSRDARLSDQTQLDTLEKCGGAPLYLNLNDSLLVQFPIVVEPKSLVLR